MANPSHSQVIAAPDSSGRLLRLVSASSVMMQLLGKSTNIRMSQILEHHEDDDFSAHRTKIVCTMGPSCWDVDKLVQLIDAGMNVCRLNFSHGDHETHGRVVKNLQEALKQRPGKRVALLLDTKGPEIRTGMLEVSVCGPLYDTSITSSKPIELNAGDMLKIVTDYSFVGNKSCIACSYQKLPTSVKPGNTILIADGSLSVEVVECGTDYVMTRVMNPATIGNKKNMNLPGVKVDLPVIGEKDKNDILNFGIPMGCNFIAASFVQSADDVRYIRSILGTKGRNIKIIPKIENVEGLLNFDEILQEADGIMIARGDLGMEIPPEKVFLAQKMMISKCNVAGKPVITATQMLESMTKNPRPTRAEAADVANAVLDGTDCVMLSGETANGSFPAQAVTVMSRVCFEAEGCIDYQQVFRATCQATMSPIDTQEAVARAAVETAQSINASLILALTETGRTARLIAKYRPMQPILALSASEETIKHLQVNRGVTTLLVPSFQGTDQLIKNALSAAKEMQLVSEGESVVAVHGMKEEVAGWSNLLKVLVVE
ncbi:LOW QUALITY PROTEIN: pyruvate kinase, putative [Eimeria mitis]|uniref:Pyruvate kinase n=1 Tax=Eimeria mitis TaxID=44415 RepID=U6JY93_9EIME|nr:LOW QUALITY PROTEIN: pyruvate kinase, putative [Eimeria mitis]CDJ30445.1 pyruvate kinase, putative [Eimeria mitis]